jgi:hypothetical protein
MSASRTRRQMIQRMGRILRRKQPGVAARFVIMFAKDTLEDPTSRIERDGFLDEIERISEATGVFDTANADALDAFLGAPGPAVVPEPERLEGYDRAGAVDDEVAYARLAFARQGPSGPEREAALAELEPRLPRPTPDAPYLEVELPDLPQIATPVVKPKQLSTGQAPLDIFRAGSEWRIRCTGCGESSEPVRFRWQALEQSVVCRCE